MNLRSEYFYAYVVSELEGEEWIPGGIMVSPPGEAVKDFCDASIEFVDPKTHRIERISTLEDFGKILLVTDKHGTHKSYMGQKVLFDDGPVSIATLMGLTNEN